MSTSTALGLAAGWLLGWAVFWRLPRLGGSRSDAAPSVRPIHDVAIVIPARNEAHALPDLLASLAGADPRVREVVVVDDGSTDGTAEVAAAAGARVVRPGAPPPGHTGKAWACTCGVRATDGDAIVFVDADVTFSPAGLTAVVDELEQHGGLVSVEPFQRVEQDYERVSAFFGAVSVMGTGAASAGRPALRTAFGPVLACLRSDYEAVGGHAAEPGAIAEDVALAGRFAGAGLGVSIFGGGDLVSFRMYPAGVRQLIEGWTKNIATGAGTTPPSRLIAVVVWIGALLSSTIGLGAAAIDLVDGRPATAVLAVAAWAAFALQAGVMFRQLGAFGARTAIGYPLLVVAFVAIFARSLYLTVVRREVRWKGRAIPLHPSHPKP